MTFESLWLSMVEKKPGLIDGEAFVTIKVSRFKELLSHFFDKGMIEASSNSMFDQLFGGKGFGTK